MVIKKALLDPQVVRNVILYALYNGVRFLFPLISTPFLAHVLGKDEFADFAIVNSCIWTSTVFMEFGFYLYGVHKTAAAGEDHAQLRRVVSSIATAKLVLSPVAMAVYLGLAWWTGVLQRETLAVILGVISAFGYGASFAWYFQGRQRGLAAVLSELLPQLVQLGLLLLLVRRPDQLWLVILLQAIPPVVAMIYALWSLARERLLALFDLHGLKEALVGGSPYFFERLCYATYTAVLPSMIAVMSTKSAVAAYSVSERFGILISGLIVPLSQATMPRVSRAVNDSDGGWRLSIALVLLMLGLTVCLATTVAASVGLILDTFFHQSYAAAAPAARIFCMTACASALAYGTANFILIPRDRARVMFWSGAIALVVGLAAQLYLTPRYGAVGASFGRFLSEGTVAVIMVAAAIALYRQQHARPRGEPQAEPSTTPSL